MKVTISTIMMVGVGMVSGQNFGAEPSCAIPCLTSAFSIAGCALTDQACQCGTGQAAIQTAVTPCLLSACSPGDVNSAASVGYALCSAYSLTAAAGNGTVAKTTTSGSATAIATGTTTGTARNGTIIMTTPPVTTSTVTAKTTSVGSGSGSGSGSVTTGSGKGTSTSASVASTSSAGAGHMLGAGLGGLVGVMGALIAAL